jgi:23S rRNA maturation-related 3'-5' exoribonuclease YhaM
MTDYFIQKIKDEFTLANVSTKYIRPVITHPYFKQYPASCTSQDGRPPVHHGEVGGLARHTYEVLRYAVAAAKPLTERVNLEALMIGAVWHDFGKVEEYATSDGVEFTRRTPQLPHICHGLMLWQQSASLLYVDNLGLFEAVAHIIAAHHGRKEWGSPVTPLTIEALLVHHADMVSVMLECGTNPTSRK